MEIKWKNVFLAIGIVFLLINIGSIVNTIAGIITDVLGAIDKAFEPFRQYSHRGDSPTYALARLCVLLIFIVGVLKLIKNWNK
jgi:hypothetical protein